MGLVVWFSGMGKPVKIIDLAKRMVHLSGLELRDEDHPEGDIAIEIVGLRPGEKLYEELLIGENVDGTVHPLIMRAYEHELSWAELVEGMISLDAACQSFDYEQVLARLGQLVREYVPAKNDSSALVWHAFAAGMSGEGNSRCLQASPYGVSNEC